MCAFIEKMLDLSKSKNGWTQFATKSSQNEKNATKSNTCSTN